MKEEISPKAMESREEAAAMLGLKPATLAKWATEHRCRLKIIKTGSRVYHRISHHEELFTENSTGGCRD